MHLIRDLRGGVASGESTGRRLLMVFTGVMAVSTVVAALVPALMLEPGLVLFAAGNVVAGAQFAFQAKRYEGRERVAWRVIGGGITLGGVGVGGVIAATVAGLDPPAFGPLDAVFLGAYGIVIAGFFALPHLHGLPIRRVRVLLDGLVGAVSVAVAAWVWLGRDLIDVVRDAPAWEVAIAVGYPVLDVAVLMSVIVVTLRRSTYRFDPRLVLLGLGASAMAIADMMFLRSGIGMSFAGADPMVSLYLLASTCLLLAGLTLESPPSPREYAERSTPWWAMVAPYGAAALLLSMLVAAVLESSATIETVELLVGSVVVVFLIIVRQAVAIRENRQMVEQQRTALVSSISHELRTPLTAMVGFLDILRDPDQHMEPEARRELLAIVDQQATYMARIVSDLIMLNRTDPDVQLQQRLVDVHEVVTSAVSSLEVDAVPGIRIEVEEYLGGFFDAGRIQQVLINLLTNAARYGGPIRMVVAKRQGNDVVLEVHDDGEGVPKRHEFAIWERFERGAHRYNAGVPGSGIGLAIVAMLIRAHQGTVGYRRSERLGGACFFAVLPGRAHTVARYDQERTSAGQGSRRDP